MKGLKQVKSPDKDLTVNVLKKYKGFEEITEDEAEKEIEIIKKLGKILYYMYLNDPQNYK